MLLTLPKNIHVTIDHSIILPYPFFIDLQKMPPFDLA